MRDYFPIIMCILTVVTMLSTGIFIMAAGAATPWEYKGCYIRQCVTDFLNTTQPSKVMISYDSDATVNYYDIWYQR